MALPSPDRTDGLGGLASPAEADVRSKSNCVAKGDVTKDGLGRV